MGTTWSVSLYAPNEELPPGELQSGIKVILESVDAIASTYRSDSEISRFNANTTSDWQPVSEDFCHMVDRSLAISVTTEGAFDITVGPMVELWGFGSTMRDGSLPSAEEVSAAMQSVGYESIEADCARPAIRKTNGRAQLDLSAWAKGHAADRIATYLDSAGLSSYVVEVGGELQLRGRRDNSDPYRIALERPASNDNLTYEVFALTDIGVATSGDYLNFYEVDGERYSHTIDPRTGRPVKHTLSSVSVISGSTADADAYATALLVMGPARAFEFAVKHDIAAYMTEYSGDGVRTQETPAFVRIARPTR